MLNVLIVIPEPDGNIGVYNYFPFCADTCENRPSLARVTKWLSENKTFQNGSLHLFLAKVTNLQGLRLKVSTLDIPPDVEVSEANTTVRGYEGDLLKLISNQMNFHPEFLVPMASNDWRQSQSNGTVLGMIGDVHRCRSHIGFGNLVPTFTAASSVDFTVSFESECLTFAVPKEQMTVLKTGGETEVCFSRNPGNCASYGSLPLCRAHKPVLSRAIPLAPCCGVKAFASGETAKVCSQHDDFESSSVYQSKLLGIKTPRLLKKSAIPTIRLKGEESSKKKARRRRSFSSRNICEVEIREYNETENENCNNIYESFAAYRDQGIQCELGMESYRNTYFAIEESMDKGSDCCDDNEDDYIVSEDSVSSGNEFDGTLCLGPQLFIVVFDCLLQLLKFCSKCGSRVCDVQTAVKLASLTVTTNCLKGHKSIWHSQPYSNGRYSVNICLATSIYLREVHILKIKLKSGDGRFDSPGYCAKYVAYITIDIDSGRIVDLVVLQKGQVAGDLEKHACEKLFLSDRHRSIRKILLTKYSEMSHEFDVWHISKSKYLQDIKQIKTCHTGGLESFHSISLKFKPIRNHFSYDGMVTSNWTENEIFQAIKEVGWYKTYKSKRHDCQYELLSIFREAVRDDQSLKLYDDPYKAIDVPRVDEGEMLERTGDAREKPLTTHIVQRNSRCENLE
ncbi:hypothetical protein PR048_003941 [Dryococelus australis]|uniref:Ionotropic glutamate receptor L-glutamate and glycine-binding domain-containing protein n=1 Tax=Dryococelus australis TaxID=614101 RepID=A0ABQ9I619_9NEOP|nr:hypothetical protein PR048_003941 [Dryococelus australis]